MTTIQAATIIAGTPAFAAPYRVRIVLGRHADCHPVLQPTLDQCLNEFPELWHYFLARDLGLVTLNPIWLAEGNATKPAFDVVRIESANSWAALEQTPDGWLFPIAARELIAATGLAKIALAGDELREVTYTWRWRATKLLDPERAWVERLGLGERQRSQAIFRRVGDGWQLQEPISIAGIRDPDLSGYSRNLPTPIVEVVWVSPSRDIAESDLQHAAAAERALFAREGHYADCSSGTERDSSGPDGQSANCGAILPGFVPSDGVTLHINSAAESFGITAWRAGGCSQYTYASSDVGMVRERTDRENCGPPTAAMVQP